MAVNGGHDPVVTVWDVLRHLLLLVERVQQVRVDAHHHHGTGDALERRLDASAVPADIVSVHLLRDLHIGHRVEATKELLTLMQIEENETNAYVLV
jgi:hypothetical protein